VWNRAKKSESLFALKRVEKKHTGKKTFYLLALECKKKLFCFGCLTNPRRDDPCYLCALQAKYDADFRESQCLEEPDALQRYTCLKEPDKMRKNFPRLLFFSRHVPKKFFCGDPKFYIF
jgi:hypothetical protein